MNHQHGPFTLTTNYTFGANNNPSNINHKALDFIKAISSMLKIFDSIKKFS